MAMFVFSVWLAWAKWGVEWVRGFYKTGPVGIGELGQTGDIFGGANALFAAFAFVGVAVAAYFQFQTFKQIEQQHARERFEPIFFELLKVFQATRQRLEEGLSQSEKYVHPYEDTNYKGVVDFADKLMSRVGHHRVVLDSGNVDFPPITRDLISSWWVMPYARFEHILGPYFRSFYHLLKRIHNSGLPAVERVEYASIVRSILTLSDLQLIAINCTTERGDGLRPLLEGYGMLKHLPTHDVRLDVTSMAEYGSFKVCEVGYLPCVRMSAEERLKCWKRGGACPAGFADMKA